MDIDHVTDYSNYIKNVWNISNVLYISAYIKIDKKKTKDAFVGLVVMSYNYIFKRLEQIPFNLLFLSFFSTLKFFRKLWALNSYFLMQSTGFRYSYF